MKGNQVLNFNSNSPEFSFNSSHDINLDSQNLVSKSKDTTVSSVTGIMAIYC
jgi:hypothetical protein